MEDPTLQVVGGGGGGGGHPHPHATTAADRFCGPYFAADLAGPRAALSPCAVDAASALLLLLFSLLSLGWAHVVWARARRGRQRGLGRQRDEAAAGPSSSRPDGGGDDARAPLLSQDEAAGADDAAERGRAAPLRPKADQTTTTAATATAASITGIEATAVGLCAALACLHGAHASAALALALPPSQLSYHCCGAAAWALGGWACLRSARRKAVQMVQLLRDEVEEEEEEEEQAAGGGASPPPPPPPLSSSSSPAAPTLLLLLPDLRPLVAASAAAYAAQAAESLAIYSRLASVAARAAAAAAAPVALLAARALRAAGLGALVSASAPGASALLLPPSPLSSSPLAAIGAAEEEDPYPPAYVKVHVWSSALALGLALCVAWCRSKQRRDEAERAQKVRERAKKVRELRAAFAAAKVPPGCPLPAELLSSADGASAPGGGREYTWPQLFVAAAAYAWPDSPALRLRVLACALLLLLVRLLNLAVPLFYKRLVDVLANASSSSSSSSSAAAALGGGGGGPPEPPAQPPSSSPSTFASLFAPWEALYLVALFFQGGAGGGIVGFLNNARSYIFIPVGQAAGRRASMAAFEHVLNELDLAWHLSRRTGEVTRVIDRGTGAVQNLLSTVVFSLGPQMVDVFAASFLLAGALQPSVAAVAFVTVALYVPMTIWLTDRRASLRKELNLRDNARGACVTDALLGWESIKLHTAEKREAARYASATDAYISSERVFVSSLNALNVAQSSLMFAGVAGGLALCTAGVARGLLTVGDVTLFLALLAQLSAPLNFFGTYFRMIAQYMVDTQSLFQLLDQRGNVRDKPGSKALVLPPPAPSGTPYEALPCVGVEFVDVSFGYPAAAAAGAGPGGAGPMMRGGGGPPPAHGGGGGRGHGGAHGSGGRGHGGGAHGGGRGGGPGGGGPAAAPAAFVPPRLVLRGVSFAAPPGGTLALVGETGSGKSTLTRLLFRFFDPWSGAVLVNGQDVRSVTQSSLRAAVGMVAQDVALFNDTIRYNIRYARPSASDAEVEAAARAAQIHDPITNRFPQGYDTVVGERGLKLSGGEKQRVAIARAFLKAPPILVFDEATSALDVNTERALQAHIKGGVGGEGGEGGYRRTALIVAHRLSTIVDADRIVVLSEGKVAEMGTHEELVALGEEKGMYAGMWAKQARGGGGGGGGGGGDNGNGGGTGGGAAAAAGAAAPAPAAAAAGAAAPQRGAGHHHHH